MAVTKTVLNLTDLTVMKKDFDTTGDTDTGSRSTNGFSVESAGSFDRTGTTGENYTMEALENNSQFVYIRPNASKYPTYDKAYYTPNQNEVVTVNKSNVSQIYVVSGQVTLEFGTPVQVNAENNYEIPAATELDITADVDSVYFHIWKI